MNLLFAIKSLTVVGGGAERVLVDLANGLVSRGHQVQVLTFDSQGDAFYPLDARVRRIDTCIGRPGQPTPRLRFLQSIPRVRRVALASKPDLVVAFMHSTYVPVMFALLGSGIPVVASEHTDVAHYRHRPLQRALVWMADRLAVAKTVPAAAIREAQPAAVRGKVKVLPNTLDLGAFEHVAAQSPSQPPIVLSVGRLMEEKNHVNLVRAFARLAPSFPEWNLRLVGEGELREALQAEIDELGMSTRISMPGAMRDVAREYQAASIVALPSRYEAFGLVAAEALACGRPVVAYEDCAGIAEMVGHEGNGLLVAATGDRVAHLAEGLARLMRDPAFRARLGRNGPAAVKRFGISNVVDLWERTFAQLVATPQRAVVNSR